MSAATEVMQARIDYLSGCVDDLKAAIRGRDRELNRLRKESLAREVIRLRAVVEEFLRLNDESDLRCADSSSLVLLLGAARSTVDGGSEHG
jgi:hypothetical protein